MTVPGELADGVHGGHLHPGEKECSGGHLGQGPFQDEGGSLP